MGELGITVLGHVARPGSRWRARAHHRCGRARAPRAPAVLLAAVRDSRRRADGAGRVGQHRCVRGEDARDHPRAHRRLRWRRGEPARRARDGPRRPDRRRRARRADLVRGLLDRRELVPRGRHLRRARAPPPRPEDAGRCADLVLGLADPGGLRRSGRGQARAAGRSGPRPAGIHRADPDHRRRAAAHADRDVRRPHHHRHERGPGRHLAAGAGHRARPRRARRRHPRVARRPGGRGADRRRRCRELRPGAAARRTTGAEPAGPVRRVPGRSRTSRTRVSSPCSRPCSTRSSRGEADPARGAGLRACSASPSTVDFDGRRPVRARRARPARGSPRSSTRSASRSTAASRATATRAAWRRS